MPHQRDADGGFTDAAGAVDPAWRLAITLFVPVIAIGIHAAFGVAHGAAVFDVDQVVDAHPTE